MEHNEPTLLRWETDTKIAKCRITAGMGLAILAVTIVRMGEEASRFVNLMETDGRQS
jgi:hypothetical protein